MRGYAARIRGWAERQHLDVRGGAAAEPFPSPEVEDYQELYRHARQQLRTTPPPRRAMRRHWQRQLWVARACLEREGGVVPPPD